MGAKSVQKLQLRDKKFQRKYLLPKERKAFKRAAKRLPSPQREFCLVLYYTGCRISEALALTPNQIDLDEKSLVIYTLKQREMFHYRIVPIPKQFVRQIYDIAESKTNDDRLFSFSRTTAFRIVNETMLSVGIVGIHASSKGLRHAFGITYVHEVGIEQVSYWMGHSSLETTRIYTTVGGREARKLAKKGW